MFIDFDNHCIRICINTPDYQSIELHFGARCSGVGHRYFVFVTNFTISVLFHHDHYYYSWHILWPWQSLLKNGFRIPQTICFLFYNCPPPGMVLLLVFRLEYWNEHVAIGIRYVKFVFSAMICNRWVQCFAVDCPCTVWYRGLTICLLYISPLFGNLILNKNWSVSSTQR